MDPHKFIENHPLREIQVLKAHNGISLSESMYVLPEGQIRVVINKLHHTWKSLYPGKYFPVWELLKLEWVWRGPKGRTLPQQIGQVCSQFGSLPDSLYGEIGDFIRNNIPPAQEVLYDITDEFKWEAGDFGDDGSCFWEGREEVRKTMEEHPDYYAFRLFDNWRNGKARCWMTLLTVKMRKRGTSQVTDANVIVMYNAYGERLSRLATLLSLAIGVDHKRIKLTNLKKTSGGLYINDNGIVVGYRHVIDSIEHIDLGLENTYDQEVGDDEIGPIDEGIELVQNFNKKYQSPKRKGKYKFFTPRKKTKSRTRTVSRRGRTRELDYRYDRNPSTRFSPMTRAYTLNSDYLRDWIYWRRAERDEWSVYRLWRLLMRRIGYDFYRVLIKILLHSNQNQGDHNGQS